MSLIFTHEAIKTKILNNFNIIYESFCKYNKLSNENFNLDKFKNKLSEFSNSFTEWRYIENIDSIFKKPAPDDSINFLLNLCLAMNNVARDYVLDLS